MITALLVAAFIEVQAPGGQMIWLNREAIVSLRHPRGVPQGHWSADVRCLVLTLDGKYLTTVETCARVRQKLSP